MTTSQRCCWRQKFSEMWCCRLVCISLRFEAS